MSASWESQGATICIEKAQVSVALCVLTLDLINVPANHYASIARPQIYSVVLAAASGFSCEVITDHFFMDLIRREILFNRETAREGERHKHFS